MKSHITFDTLAYANKLKDVGVESRIAETQAEATAEILTNLIDDRLSTKDDLKYLELSTKDNLKHLELSTKNNIKDLESNIKNLELSTKNDIKDLEMRMYSFIFKAISANIAIIGSLQTLFHFLQ